MSFLCPTCRQPLENAAEATYLGLSVSALARVISWEDGRELGQLRPMALRLLYEIVKGGPRGARTSALTVIASDSSRAVSVHGSAIRRWIEAHELPIGLMNDQCRYVLVPDPAD